MSAPRPADVLRGALLTIFAAALAASSVCCAAPSAQIDLTSAPILAATACPHVARFPALTPADRDARLAAFRARNPGTWTFSQDGGGSAVDAITGAVTMGRRSDGGAGTKSVSDDVAIRGVRDFVARNADLLMITQAELAASKVWMSTEYGPLTVRLHETHDLAGLEGYRIPPNRISYFHFSLAPDGTVRSFGRMSGSGPAELRLCPASSVKVDDAKIDRAIVGAELVYHAREYVPSHPPMPFGKATHRDIARKLPMVAVSHEADGSEVYRIGWYVVVERAGHAWFFEVDDVSGALLHGPEGLF